MRQTLPLCLVVLIMASACAPLQRMDPETTAPGQSMQHAYGIALDSCHEGTVSDQGFFNPNSRTWWFDIAADKPGCSPACVVAEDGSAEVNWRCTGLIVPS